MIADRIIDHADQRTQMFVCQTDADAEQRQVAGEVAGAVQRVDVPEVVGLVSGGAGVPTFFADDMVIGEGFPQGRDDHRLRSHIAFGH